MNCPVCVSVPLVMTERSGVEIDYCPNCRGVWLDRGELDKIIERTNQSMAAGSPTGFTAEAPREVRPSQPTSYPAPHTRDYDRERSHYKRHDYDDDDYRYKKKKRGGFLGELFDFD